jgi:hypothetical protein
VNLKVVIRLNPELFVTILHKFVPKIDYISGQPSTFWRRLHEFLLIVADSTYLGLTIS